MMVSGKIINKELLLERLNIIQKAIIRLKDLEELSEGGLALDDNFAIAEHNLRYALEAVFDICGHILSRIPGNKSDEYKEMAREMGRQGIVDKEFVENKLVKMAGYRNRLTHLYFEITGREIYDIIHNNLDDFEVFERYIKKFLKNIG